ncbi:MAG TPA: fatty acid--CoA ligase [Burkholderiaceae bacterium]|jgi:fatty-acyl-CoA synthase|nr:fatty acid--CoA ligase [Burkholderiaceae bacterium]
MTAGTIERTPSAYGYPLLIKRLLASGLRRAPQQEIVYADRKRLTYCEFARRVGRLASGLASLGIRYGDTVGVMDWDSHRYLECFFAVPMVGAVLHTINIRLSPEQILYTINHADDDVILVNAEFLPCLEQIWDRVDTGKKLVLLNDGGGVPQTSLAFVAEYEDLLARSSPDFEFADFDEDTRATTFYTTGTTGLPKGVYFSHRQLVLHTMAFRGSLAGEGQGRFNEGDVYMPVTPMFHVHAWGVPYVAVAMGVKQVYPGRYFPEQLLELHQREKVTFSHCVPTILQMMLNCAAGKGINLAGWTVIIGGAALARPLARQALEMGIDAFAAYGMSETCPLLTLAQLEPHMQTWDIDRQVEMRCKTGRPVAMVELRIVDEAMREVPHDGRSAGEIVVRAPWLTQGYLKDEQSSRNLWHGGWLHTGDIAVMDEKGWLKITDRLKDVIKTGGEWISSLDLEDLIMRCPGVAEVAVIGVPDPKWTERPLAVVAAKPGHDVCQADIQAHLCELAAKGIISKYGVPERIVFVEALPKTSVGKLDKKALRGRFGQ